MSDAPQTSEYLTGDRVLYRGRFGPPGTVVATAPGANGESWLWVMWDEYPEGHEPTTHGSWACTLKERPDPHPHGIVEFPPPVDGARFMHPSSGPWEGLWRGCVVDLRSCCGWRWGTLSLAYPDALAWMRGDG